MLEDGAELGGERAQGEPGARPQALGLVVEPAGGEERALVRSQTGALDRGIVGFVDREAQAAALARCRRVDGFAHETRVLRSRGQRRFVPGRAGTRNPEPGTRNPERGTRHPEPGTRNPEPGTRNPEPGTRNPEPGRPDARCPDARTPGSPLPDRPAGASRAVRGTATLRAGRNRRGLLLAELGGDHA